MISKKKIVAALGVAALTLGACSNSGDSKSEGEAGTGDLVLYSSMTESDLQTFQDVMGEKFPDLNIEVVNGTAGELTTRMAAEKNNPQADMMWGGLDAADGDMHKDIFEAWLSDSEDKVPEKYKSPNGFYNMDHLSTAAFAVNPKLAKDLGVEIKGYKDLLNPKLKGKILMADPSSSSSAWNNVSNIMAVYGYDSPESWEYIQGLLDNGLVIASSSSAAFKSVDDGEYVVGLTYEDGIAALQKSGAENVKLVYPEEGTSASVFGCAVVKGAPHEANAKAVINYLMSPEGQVKIGEKNETLRMTTDQDYKIKYLPPASEIKWVDRDVKWLSENREEVVAHWQKLITARG